MKTTIPGAARRTTPQRYQVTFGEFCHLVQDGQKADLLDGVVYMASPDNIEANTLNGWLYWLMEGYLEFQELGGMISLLRVAYRLDDHSSPEPDIGYIKAKKLNRVKKGHIDAAPDLGLEIVSPDSITRDYEDKRRKYQEAGVEEYWIIDPLERTITLLRLNKDGVYQEVRPKAGRYTSKVLRGFWLQAEWLWKSPLPNKQATLKTILGGQP